MWSAAQRFVVTLGLLAVAGCVESNDAGPGSAGSTSAGTAEMLHVSNDPTRELWRAMNEAFIPAYQQESGTRVEIKQSHGGSGAQARAVIDGLEADVVSLGLWSDTDQLRKKGLLAEDWENKLPSRSLAYTSTIVFVVRKGNPKQVKDWPDLVKPGVEVVIPNPKTSGNGRLAFVAGWGSVLLRGGDEAAAQKYVTELFQHVPVLDTGARGATATFATKGLGDVHLTWENEARLEVAESEGELELVYPPISILADPPLAVVDGNVDRKGTRAVAEAYAKFVFSKEGQRILAENYYRPTDPEVFEAHKDRFPTLKLFSVNEVAKNWDDAQSRFFAEGGVFDSIYQKK